MPKSPFKCFVSQTHDTRKMNTFIISIDCLEVIKFHMLCFFDFPILSFSDTESLILKNSEAFLVNSLAIYLFYHFGSLGCDY